MKTQLFISIFNPTLKRGIDKNHTIPFSRVAEYSAKA